jgi:hypothetical protein
MLIVHCIANESIYLSFRHLAHQMAEAASHRCVYCPKRYLRLAHLRRHTLKKHPAMWLTERTLRVNARHRLTQAGRSLMQAMATRPMERIRLTRFTDAFVRDFPLADFQRYMRELGLSTTEMSYWRDRRSQLQDVNNTQGFTLGPHEVGPCRNNCYAAFGIPRGSRGCSCGRSAQGSPATGTRACISATDVIVVKPEGPQDNLATNELQRTFRQSCL